MRRFFTERRIWHLKTKVVAEDGLVTFQKSPVEGREGAGARASGLLWVELAVAAEVGHFVDVSSPRDVGLGGGEAAVGVGGHAEDVGLDDPIVGVDIGEPEPVG